METTFRGKYQVRHQRSIIDITTRTPSIQKLAKVGAIGISGRIGAACVFQGLRVQVAVEDLRSSKIPLRQDSQSIVAHSEHQVPRM